MSSPTSRPPNIILILCDDMGFSDIGSYGSEIRTPNLDRMAEHGIRFTQIYNSARCCPSRASLLTGVNPHQAGIGHMTADLGHPSYRGYLSPNAATIAEALRGRGYRTMISGKWNVGGDYVSSAPIGDPDHPLPTQRGFDRFWGTVGGGGSYFNPPTLMDQETPINVGSTDFYLTEAITDKAVEMIDEAHRRDQQFFLYCAYTAPHWPLHALADDIARYEGRYRGGWDQLRTDRHEQLKGLGLLEAKWPISPRDVDAPPWKDVRHNEWEAMRMSVYAAQIDRMDQGIGRIMAEVQRIGQEDNTLVMFLSDNGGCAEFLYEDPSVPEPSWYASPTVDGRPICIGNRPDIKPGPDDTFMTYDLPWANASNSPFRLFKGWLHEGGISTPFIMHWPARVAKSAIVHTQAHIMDITATCPDAAGSTWPDQLDGNRIIPLEGESLMPVVDGPEWNRARPICWEHEGNLAVRLGQ